MNTETTNINNVLTNIKKKLENERWLYWILKKKQKKL